MTGKALIQTRPEGYVVIWFEDGTSTPLRNFGNYHSAAYDFREYINNKLAYTDNLHKRIRGWSETYNPNDLYTYPEIRQSGEITLKRQRQRN